MLKRKNGKDIKPKWRLYKDELHETRGQAAQKITEIKSLSGVARIQRMQLLQTDFKKHYLNILSSIFTTITSILGEPPSGICIIAFGSISRGDVNGDSDIEPGFILKEGLSENDIKKAIQYIQNFRQLWKFEMIAIGESTESCAGFHLDDGSGKDLFNNYEEYVNHVITNIGANEECETDNTKLRPLFIFGDKSIYNKASDLIHKKLHNDAIGKDAKKRSLKKIADAIQNPDILDCGVTPDKKLEPKKKYTQLLVWAITQYAINNGLPIDHSVHPFDVINWLSQKQFFTEDFINLCRTKLCWLYEQRMKHSLASFGFKSTLPFTSDEEQKEIALIDKDLLKPFGLLLSKNIQEKKSDNGKKIDLSEFSKKSDGADIYRKTQSEQTLISAIVKSNIENLQILLPEGSKIKMEESELVTHLYYLVKENKLDVFNFLLSRGMNINGKNQLGLTCLLMAVRDNEIKIEVIKFLVSKGADFEITDDDGNTAVNLAASFGLLDIIQFLHSQGAKLNTINQNRQSPISFAAKNGDIETLEYLLENGAQINHQDKDGNTPLYIAASEGKFQAVQYLLTANADYNIENNYGNTPFMIAAQNAHMIAYRLLFCNKGGADRRNYLGNTAICLAAAAGSIEVLKDLYHKNRVVNHPNFVGNTPLCLSAINDKVEILEFLHKQNSNCEYKNYLGISIVMLAALNKSKKSLQYLKKIGIKYDKKMITSIKDDIDDLFKQCVQLIKAKFLETAILCLEIIYANIPNYTCPPYDIEINHFINGVKKESRTKPINISFCLISDAKSGELFNFVYKFSRELKIKSLATEADKKPIFKYLTFAIAEFLKSSKKTSLAGSTDSYLDLEQKGDILYTEGKITEALDCYINELTNGVHIILIDKIINIINQLKLFEEKVKFYEKALSTVPDNRYFKSSKDNLIAYKTKQDHIVADIDNKKRAIPKIISSIQVSSITSKATINEVLSTPSQNTNTMIFTSPPSSTKLTPFTSRVNRLTFGQKQLLPSISPLQAPINQNTNVNSDTYNRSPANTELELFEANTNYISCEDSDNQKLLMYTAAKEKREAEFSEKRRELDQRKKELEERKLLLRKKEESECSHIKSYELIQPSQFAVKIINPPIFHPVEPSESASSDIQVTHALKLMSPISPSKPAPPLKLDPRFTASAAVMGNPNRTLPLADLPPPPASLLANQSMCSDSAVKVTPNSSSVAVSDRNLPVKPKPAPQIATVTISPRSSTAGAGSSRASVNEVPSQRVVLGNNRILSKDNNETITPQTDAPNYRP